MGIEWTWDSAGAMAGLMVVAEAAVKGTVLLLLAWGVTAGMRRGSAAVRHWVWVAAAAGLLLLPVLTFVLPGWGVLPNWMAVKAPPLPNVPAMSPEPITLDAIRDIPAAGEPATPAAPPVTVTAIAPPLAISGPWLVVTLWTAGVLAMLVPLALGALRLRRLRREGAEVKETPWRELLARLATVAGVKRQVELRQNGRCAVPLTYGVRRPVILLPAEAMNWPDERRRMALLHELAHIGRQDCLLQLFLRCVRALYWYHPLAWVAVARVQAECERACDDRVLGAGTRGSTYAAALMEYAAPLMRGGHVPTGALAMARTSTLEGRLLAILDGRRNRRGVTWRVGVGVLAVIVGIAAALGMLRARGQEAALQAKAGGAGATNGSAATRADNPDAGWGEATNGLRIRLVVPRLDQDGVPALSEQSCQARLEVWNTGTTALEIPVQNLSSGRRSEAEEWVIGLDILTIDSNRGSDHYWRADNMDDYWSKVGNSPTGKEVKPGERVSFGIRLHRLVNWEGHNLLGQTRRLELQPMLGGIRGRPVPVRIEGAGEGAATRLATQAGGAETRATTVPGAVGAVYVIGEVERPAGYRSVKEGTGERSTIAEAVELAGIKGEKEAMGVTVVRRGAGERESRTTLSWKELSSAGKGGMRAEDGDVVIVARMPAIVPAQGPAVANGEGTFSVLGGGDQGTYNIVEPRMTIKQGLALAHVDLGNPDALDITLYRRTEGNTAAIHTEHIDPVGLLAGAQADRFLQSGDLIQVSARNATGSPATTRGVVADTAPGQVKTERVALKTANGKDVARLVNNMFAPPRADGIRSNARASVDEGGNTIIITGTEEDLTQARELIARLERMDDLVHTSVFFIVKLKAAKAAEIAVTLHAQYTTTPPGAASRTTIPALVGNGTTAPLIAAYFVPNPDTNSVLVTCDVSKESEIRAYIKKLDDAAAATTKAAASMP